MGNNTYVLNNSLAGTDPSGYCSEGNDSDDSSCNSPKTTTKVEEGDKIAEGEDGNRYLDKGDGYLVKIESVSATVNGKDFTVNYSKGEATSLEVSSIGSRAE